MIEKLLSSTSIKFIAINVLAFAGLLVSKLAILPILVFQIYLIVYGLGFLPYMVSKYKHIFATNEATLFQSILWMIFMLYSAFMLFLSLMMMFALIASITSIFSDLGIFIFGTFFSILASLIFLFANLNSKQHYPNKKEIKNV